MDQVLDQVPVKYAGHLRLFHFRKLAEERGWLVQIDSDILTLLLGHAHAHRGAKSGFAISRKQIEPTEMGSYYNVDQSIAVEISRRYVIR